MNSFDLKHLNLLPQECGGLFKFDSQLVITAGFAAEFGKQATIIAINALERIINERVKSDNGADYLQVLTYECIKFWMIDDVHIVTVLLPGDY
ncbi:hypothetical protein [Petroclostridium sp. X23]|uniref:hypothetical protein n=1 Tax=Petroclostridium sp. X23 TaxID=3045146 RepID=UPI0024ADE7A7|nr:hypothetical protein [Petroclostridium sp. X23]WHH57185.1 hypothetical protein QKW49_15210 [Petroclostridium sp. X23]